MPDKRIMRSIPATFQTREDGGNLIIEGYFAVFNSRYEIGAGLSEVILPGAFRNTVAQDDIRALINHDTTLVIGRNKAGTLTLKEDERGLFGIIVVNPNDTDAMNCHARVERGDVTQCSIGFDIVREETEFFEDGSIQWQIREVKLWEVSVCTFPAYEETEIEARKAEAETIKKRAADAWRAKMTKRLKGETDGAEGINAP